MVGGVGVLLGVSTCRFQVLSQLIKQPLTRWSLHIRSALHALCRSKVSIFLGLNIERQTAGQSPTNHSALSFMTCVMSSGRQGLSKQTNKHKFVYEVTSVAHLTAAPYRQIWVWVVSWSLFFPSVLAVLVAFNFSRHRGGFMVCSDRFLVVAFFNQYYQFC